MRNKLNLLSQQVNETGSPLSFVFLLYISCIATFLTLKYVATLFNDQLAVVELSLLTFTAALTLWACAQKHDKYLYVINK